MVKLVEDTSAEALIKKLELCHTRIMKRCFMTGKQCIFSSVISTKTSQKSNSRQVKNPKKKELNFFIIMPFKPNLETFYQWSLKPFLLQHYRLQDHNIQRADEVLDMGYVVCEKICKKIQEADIVFADISVENPNVFYEIGLAYGLERPVILIQKEAMHQEDAIPDLLSDPRVMMSLSYNYNLQNALRQKIFRYRGVSKIQVDNKYPLDAHILKPYRQPQINKELKISVIDCSHIHHSSNSKNEDIKNEDICLDFYHILTGACNVAMEEIKNVLKKIENKQKEEQKEGQKEKPKEEMPRDEYTDRLWRQIQNNINLESDFRNIETIPVNGMEGYDRITRQIESSFCIIIDVTPGTPNTLLAYFWLGYCHSRGVNVIPVFRMKDKEDQKKCSDDKLAFDIRSLWYADYFEKEPYKFKERIREIFEYLLIRDIPDRQKRDFWSRFPPENEIKVFTGAIHVKDLMREVVGDWDVRAVSEIFTYLPMIRETSAPRLITPFYSPEEAFKKFKTENPKSSIEERKAEFIERFNEDIEKQLQHCNAIVIASPDVNPVTEYLLNKIYRVKSENKYIVPFSSCPKPNFDGYVVIKEKTAIQKNEAKPKNDDEDILFPRIFSQDVIPVSKIKPKKSGITTQLRRGFRLHKHTVFVSDESALKPYFSQNEIDKLEKPFEIVGHLLVARYPATEQGNFIILLNGVSGPATFALAQILTGGGQNKESLQMNSRSEDMLRLINKRLDDPKCIGVQGLVLVRIERGTDATSDENQNPDTNQMLERNNKKCKIKKPDGDEEYITNVDSRRVVSWEWLGDYPESIFIADDQKNK
jgi:nucleoside 2-deoxyribosyltransferase